MKLYIFQVFENKGYQSGVIPHYSQNQLLRNNYKSVEFNTSVLQTSNTENDQTLEQSHPCSSSSSAELSQPYSSLNLSKSTFEKSQASSSSNIVKFTSGETKCCLNTTLIESPSEESQLSSSLKLIKSTPEKLQGETELRHFDGIAIDATDHIHKQNTQDIKYLPVNQFRLNNDEERTMCINQQKNSWLQLNHSKKDFQSAIEKSSVTGHLSILKRDREENDGGKRVVKRKISEYFLPKR